MKLKLQQKAQFFHQFAALLNSGIGAQQSLTLAGRDCPPSFQSYLQKASAATATGLGVADALAGDRPYFDSWTLSLIRLAEYSGALSETCEMLATDAEARLRRDRLYRAIRLRAIAFIWSLLVFIAALFNPNATGIIKPEFWLRSLGIGLLLLAVAFVLPRYYSRGLQEIARNLPIWDKIAEARSLLLFTKLQLPLSCGVPMLAALELVRSHVPDIQLEKSLATAAQKVRTGASLSNSLTGKLPRIAMQIIRTGEESGTLDSALQHIAEYYEGELERRLRLLQNSLQLINLLMFGGLIAVVGIRTLTLILNSLPE